MIPSNKALNIPNTETLEAIEEVKAMKQNPSHYKTYTNVDDMMKAFSDWSVE